MKKTLLAVATLASTVLLGCSEYLCLAPPGTTASTKLSICHTTGKKGKYELITVKASAAQSHADHGDFLAPDGAKKNSDCAEPVDVTPPSTTPPTGTPTTNPPTTTPPTPTTPTTPPSVIDTVLEAVKELPDELKEVSCIVDPSQPQCQL